ncbi:hypothetical protein A9Q79_04845 [Methylophaga sp. 42_25_T18]|nr:hypothetical protein A9Q79_04845 [Methylophaga sp. 42_25_T18]OUR85755.1 hypothetical protein A9Q92_07490 [Methylophaga sp. 42_8_T64]
MSACTNVQPQQKVVASDPDDSTFSRLAKSDIDEVIELHQRTVMKHLEQLMIKLYKRNPSARYDKAQRNIEDSVNLVFSRPHDFKYTQLNNRSSTDLIYLALDPEYQGGDRVLPFIVGLRSMLMASYDLHTEFYYLTSIDEQKLYNSARNIEIAAWLLAESRNEQDDLYLLSDSLENERRNLSYQRLLGQMIATQDNLADIVSHKTGRLIKTVVVKAASMMFLPI